MSFIKKLLDISDLSILFKPRINDEKERQQTIDWINHALTPVLRSVFDDIKTEKRGFYPHPENQQALNLSADSLGYIRYTVNNKAGQRLELSPLSLVSCNSIKMTENYGKLKSQLGDAGYNLELKEININAEGVDVYETSDENTPDLGRYFILLVSGW